MLSTRVPSPTRVAAPRCRAWGISHLRDAPKDGQLPTRHLPGGALRRPGVREHDGAGCVPRRTMHDVAVAAADGALVTGPMAFRACGVTGSRDGDGGAALSRPARAAPNLGSARAARATHYTVATAARSRQ